MNESSTVVETQTSSVEIHGPGGVWGKVSGYHIVETMQLIVLVLTLVGVALVWWTNEINRGQFLQQHQITQSLLRTVIENQGILIKMTNETQRSIVDATQINTYVMSLPQQHRESLKLTMPDALRYRLRGADRLP